MNIYTTYGLCMIRIKHNGCWAQVNDDSGRGRGRLYKWH